MVDWSAGRAGDHDLDGTRAVDRAGKHTVLGPDTVELRKRHDWVVQRACQREHFPL